MGIIEFKDVSFQYPNGFSAVENVSFEINEGEAIAIIGQNGAGKTTTVKMINGLLKPTHGTVLIDGMDTKDYTTAQLSKIAGYVFQNPDDQIFHNNVEDEIRFGPKKQGLSEEEIVKKTEWAAKLCGLSEQMQENPYNLPLSIRKFVSIASVLAMDDKILILDEPTNFLDTTHVEWLVKYLKEYKGNFLIVSHNQEFLNDVVNVVMELESGKITKYKGNYQQYLQKKMLVDADYEKKYLSQQRQIKELKTYIEKNKVKTSTARQAQSRMKKLEKIDILEKPKSNDIYLNLAFNYQPIASDRFLRVNNLEIGYDKSLLPPISFEIRSGVKLAITGFNGIGKTTLLRTLIGELKPIDGEFHFVDHAKIAYFEQEHHFDNPNLTPLEEIQSLYPQMDNGSIRSRLARCGISGNIAISPIKNLSGGEQSKVKLCKIMLQKANVLILDEPTNHLDKLAKEGLLEALKKYNGTVIFVSHESDFVNRLATKIYNIEDLLLN